MNQRTADDIAREVHDLYADYYLKMERIAKDRVEHLTTLQQEWTVLTGGSDEDWIAFMTEAAM